MLTGGGLVKASDITDSAFIDAVLFCCAEREMSVATRWDVTAVLAGHPEDVGGGPRDYPGMPWKVVLAKARSLIRRGLIDGCDCGCRGDFKVKPPSAVDEMAEMIRATAADQAAAAGVPADLWQACVEATAAEMARIRAFEVALARRAADRIEAWTPAWQEVMRLALAESPENVTPPV